MAQPNGNGELSDSRNQKMHILLLMTWCLPIVAPALAVWVRTLVTAGITTPFDGDHFVGNVLVFMVVVYSMSLSNGRLFERQHRFVVNYIQPLIAFFSPYGYGQLMPFISFSSKEIIPVGWCYGVGSVITFVLGPRSTYRVYEATNWSTAFLFLFRVLPKLLS